MLKCPCWFIQLPHPHLLCIQGECAWVLHALDEHTALVALILALRVCSVSWKKEGLVYVDTEAAHETRQNSFDGVQHAGCIGHSASHTSMRVHWTTHSPEHSEHTSCACIEARDSCGALCVHSTAEATCMRALALFPALRRAAHSP